MKSLKPAPAVLIVGGYGIVGSQIATIFRKRNPSTPIIIAGHNITKAEKFASTLSNARGAVVDVYKKHQISDLDTSISVVVTAVNDPENNILSDIIQHNIPYIDICRWTSRVREALILSTINSPTQPIIFSSSWMAGVASIVAKIATTSFKSVNKIDIDILYSLKDKAGPNSVEYIDQLATPFDVLEDGKMSSVTPMTDPKQIEFSGGFKAKTFRFDTPDQMTLPIICNASSVSARIGYDDNTSAAFLSLLVRSGIWSLLNRPIFTKLRRSLLYNPGTGGSHEIVINVSGVSKNMASLNTTSTIVDEKGQTHLTAVGSVIQLERVLSLNGNVSAPVGISFPEKHESIDIAVATLKQEGIKISIGS